MALNTDSDLVSAIADWLNRSDLSDRIPDFMQIARLKINRKLSITEQQSVTSITPTAQTATLPTGITGLISVSDSKGNNLEAVSMQEMFDYSDEGGSVCRYSVSGGDIYFSPTPAATNTDAFNVLYRTSTGLDPIVGLQDIYLNASLQEAYVYLKDDARVSYFKAMTDEGVSEAQAQRAKKGVGRSRIKDDSIQANGGPLV